MFKRRRHARAAPFLLIAGTIGLVAVLVTAIMATRDDASVTPGERAVHDPGPIHIHALGINPRDDALFVASHTGLYRIGRSENVARRVSDRRQDTMGFTVAAADHFLGSGHPDLRDGLPSRLGLIQSRDGGKRWRPISLLGKADFHVLRARGRQIVAYDASKGRIFVSRDRGQHWRAHRFEGPLVDLVIAPGRPQILLATSPAQLLLSRDGGRSWGSIVETSGLLAWPKRERLYLLAPDGRLWLSPDRGRRWRALGEIAGRPAAFATYTNGRMYAALHDGTIKRSTDGGRSWRLLARPG
jgi:photosystem II stability/assembly factor-like uncharacterized protein